MKQNTLVFDFDGVIADSLEATAEIFNQLVKEFDFEKPGVNGLEVYKKKGAKAAVKTLGIPIRKLPVIMNKYREGMAKIVSTLKPVKGIKEVLVELKKREFNLGVLTSNLESNVNRFLENNDLTLFDFIYSEGNLFGKDKTMRKMLEDLKLSSEQVIYIGDETRDIDAAKKVGIKVAAVTWGYNSAKALKERNPDHIINRPNELLSL